LNARKSNSNCKAADMNSISMMNSLLFSVSTLKKTAQSTAQKQTITKKKNFNFTSSSAVILSPNNSQLPIAKI